MKARESSLDLDKNLGKTMVVQNPGGKGAGQPGFYCESCNRTYKDTVGYLDHINSRARMYPSPSYLTPKYQLVSGRSTSNGSVDENRAINRGTSPCQDNNAS